MKICKTDTNFEHTELKTIHIRWYVSSKCVIRCHRLVIIIVPLWHHICVVRTQMVCACLGYALAHNKHTGLDNHIHTVVLQQYVCTTAYKYCQCIYPTNIPTMSCVAFVNKG